MTTESGEGISGGDMMAEGVNQPACGIMTKDDTTHEKTYIRAGHLPQMLPRKLEGGTETNSCASST